MVRETHPEAYALYLQARLVGRLEESIASHRTTLTLSPEHVSSQYRIGLASLAKGEPESALEAMQLEAIDFSVTLPE